MAVVAQNVPAKSTTGMTSSATTSQRSSLQRKCACGGAPGPTGECAACRRNRRPGEKPRPRQPKLAINQPNDQDEQAADRVAAQVMRMAEPRLHHQRVHTAVVNGEGLHTKPTLQKASRMGDVRAAAPPIVHEVLGSQGMAAAHPLDAATRGLMEARFGHDFSRVRVHTNGKAAESAQAVNAHAYTVGHQIVFAANRYAPATAAGRHLLAHELTHVLQQESQPSVYHLQRSCGPAAIGSVGDCIGVGGEDITDLAVSSANLFLFEVGCDEFRAGEEARLRTRIGSITPDETVEIHGFASEEGSATFNDDLSCARAHTAADIFAQEAIPAPITLFQHGATPGGREDRRSVVLHVRTVAPATPANPCAPGVLPNPATSIDEYVQLVRCAEQAFPSHTPRQMLSLLRQFYYGNQAWSRTRLRFWENVIPCGLSLADPRPGLGPDLTSTLRASQVVAGVDMGHVFTGLEAMVCPSSTVELETPGPNVIVSMSNEEFATWGGDLGSAAARKTHDEVDLGITRPWTNYFGTAGTPASHEDLEGDIDSYVIRKGLSGTACSATAGTALPALTSPISQLLHEYYTAAPTTLGGTRTDYARCFVQALGGTVSGSRITNKSALVTPMRNRVESFARTFYLGLVTVPLFAIGPVEGMRLLQYSWEGTELFLDWLEGKL